MNRNHMSALFVAKVMPTKPNWKVIKWMFTSDPDLLNVGLMSNVVRISTNWPTVMLMKKMSINLMAEQWNHSRIIQKSYQNYCELFYYVFLIELEIIKIYTYLKDATYYNWCLVQFLSGAMKLVCGPHILFYLN